MSQRTHPISSLIPSMFRPFTEQPPSSRVGFKREWNYSRGMRPGRWSFRAYTIDDAIDAEIFEFDEEGSYWSYVYEEWIPRNDELADPVMDLGIEPSFRDELLERNSDFRDYRYRVFQHFGHSLYTNNRKRCR